MQFFKDEEISNYYVAMIITLIITFSLHLFHFYKKYQENRVKQQKIIAGTASAKFETLKNQIDPHFLFNSLNVLSSLIEENPDSAQRFTTSLSKVYRYVLEHKENEVVSLQTEADFIQHYISLLNIRYKNVLEISMNISKAGLEKGIVMVTLQMLIDNAIKHNSLETEAPLTIRIWNEEGYLHVSNNKQLRRQIETSNKQGLAQLKELYSYLTKQEVKIQDSPEKFEIKLPLL